MPRLWAATRGHTTPTATTSALAAIAAGIDRHIDGYDAYIATADDHDGRVHPSARLDHARTSRRTEDGKGTARCSRHRACVTVRRTVSMETCGTPTRRRRQPTRPHRQVTTHRRTRINKSDGDGYDGDPEEGEDEHRPARSASLPTTRHPGPTFTFKFLRRRGGPDNPSVDNALPEGPLQRRWASPRSEGLQQAIDSTNDRRTFPNYAAAEIDADLQSLAGCDGATKWFAWSTENAAAPTTAAVLGRRSQ